MDQPTVRVDALAIPAQQGAHSKGVPKVMQSGRRNTRRQVQTELGNEGVECLTDGFRTYTAAFGKRKQWPFGFRLLAMAFLHVTAKTSCQVGPERHDPIFAEFRFANKQCVALKVNVT